MSRKLLANGREKKRSQIKARRAGITVKVGFGPTDRRTGKLVKPPARGKRRS
jgi:hypothetical protein